MEQRGSGIRRMRDAMLNHGLEAPRFDLRDGYFRVTLVGPGDNLDRIVAPESATGGIPPSVEAQLNARQKQIMLQVQTEGSVTSGWCRKTFGVTYDTAYRDLSDLVDRGILVQLGKGRSTRYELDVEAR